MNQQQQHLQQQLLRQQHQQQPHVLSLRTHSDEAIVLENNVSSRLLGFQQKPLSPRYKACNNPSVQQLEEWYKQQIHTLDRYKSKIQEKLEMLLTRKEALVALIDSTVAQSAAAFMEQQQRSKQNNRHAKSLEVLRHQLDKARAEVKQVDCLIESLNDRMKIAGESVSFYQRQIKKRWCRISADQQAVLTREGVELLSDVVLVDEDVFDDDMHQQDRLVGEIRELHCKEVCLSVEIELLVAEKRAFSEAKEQLIEHRQKLKDEIRTLEHGETWKTVIEDLIKEVETLESKIVPVQLQLQEVEIMKASFLERFQALFNHFPSLSSESFEIAHVDCKFSLFTDDVKTESVPEFAVWISKDFLLLEPEVPEKEMALDLLKAWSFCIPSSNVIYCRHASRSFHDCVKVSLSGNWNNFFQCRITRSECNSLELFSPSDNNGPQNLLIECEALKRSSCLSRIDITPDESFVSEATLGEIICKGPQRFRAESWNRVYKLSMDGSATSTFSRVIDNRSPVILLVKTMTEEVFGFYSCTPWKISKTYFGNGECFVFGSVGYSSTKFFKWSGKNSFFQLLNSSYLAIGGGSSHALYLDMSLSRGTTGYCETFNSPALCSAHCFEVMGIELWGVVKD
eukprot:TRINITY_DN10574_c0_g1_i3.p2 TRINITY_DN10574_c0_g1~~TRINITY_DN10574_c0_g1_i3.p2  ORF type:complete len:626 (-),score=148.26 TRINITY_DN10574_c0_g1_i3:2176-4053(-)